MKRTTKYMSATRFEATDQEIAVCAYCIWEQEGKPEGRALDHWLQAEFQLTASSWHEFLWHEEQRLRPFHTDLVAAELRG
ncbi:MAG TPA: DUF2934 domain-containing protein [Terrimicrobiaceae bacterium]